MMPAQLLKPGEVVSSDAAETWLYHASGKPDALTNQVGTDFNQAGITTTVTRDVHDFIWQKACFNVAMNALCGLVSGSPGMLNHFPDGKALAHEIVDETLVIAKASGANVDAEKVHALIEYACANHLKHKPSMLQDLENERGTEVAALNGYIVDLSAKLALDAPLNRMLARLVKLKEGAPEFWTSA
jgi:2-dehydropantoate 2-reductase